jgi:hypothetical protein
MYVEIVPEVKKDSICTVSTYILSVYVYYGTRWIDHDQFHLRQPYNGLYRPKNGQVIGLLSLGTQSTAAYQRGVHFLPLVGCSST